MESSLSLTTETTAATLFFVDAAQYNNTYFIGIFHAQLGIQVHIAPPQISNQQMAEL